MKASKYELKYKWETLSFSDNYYYANVLKNQGAIQFF